MRYVELRRHTDNDGDALTPDGISAAEAIGRDRLNPPYAAFVSTGAARATQMLKILGPASRRSPSGFPDHRAGAYVVRGAHLHQ